MILRLFSILRKFYFFASGFNGLFNVCLDSDCVTHTDGLGLDGSQLYTGSELSPTIGTGTFTSTEFFIAVNGATFEEPNATVVISAIPEPKLSWLVGTGLFVIVCAAR